MKTRHFFIVLGILASSAMSRQDARAGTLQIVRSIDHPIPYEGSMDIAWDGQHLWTLTMRSNVFPGQSIAVMHELDPSDGSVLSWTDIGNSNYRGLTWDGTSLWNTHHVLIMGGGVEPGSPPDVAPDVMEERSANGTIVSSFELPHSPDAVPRGAAFDGAFLWISDYKHGQITQVDPDDGSVITSFATPGTEPRGLAWDGSSLWLVDGAEGLIFQMDTSGNLLETWNSPLTDPYGIAFDGEYFWVLDNDLENSPTSIFQLAIPEPSTLVLLTIGGVAVGTVVLQNRLKSRQST